MNKEDLLKDIKEKYLYHSELIRVNRLDTPHIHKQYCTSNRHNKCGQTWGHSCIVLDLICKIYWCITGTKIFNLAEKRHREGSESRKPKLSNITYQVLSQRKEDELTEDEYKWFMNLIKQAKGFITDCK